MPKCLGLWAEMRLDVSSETATWCLEQAHTTANDHQRKHHSKIGCTIQPEVPFKLGLRNHPSKHQHHAVNVGGTQGSNVMAQQGDASTTAKTSDATTPDHNNSGANAMQEHGAMDPDVSLLSELASRTPQFGLNVMSQFSPILSQGATPTQGATPSGVNPSAPPRPNASDISGAMNVGADLLNDQGATVTAGSTSVLGNVILAPSPRQTTQSPETHRLQQTLRNDANE